jgi:hypothetical protein
MISRAMRSIATQSCHVRGWFVISVARSMIGATSLFVSKGMSITPARAP